MSLYRYKKIFLEGVQNFIHWLFYKKPNCRYYSRPYCIVVDYLVISDCCDSSCFRNIGL